MLGAWDLRREAEGVMHKGGRAPSTYLAEAAEAGQCRRFERKVSHCGRKERGGIRLWDEL